MSNPLITDTMIDHAWAAFGRSNNSMRAAIEAALAAREQMDNNTIDKLVEALRPFAEIATELSDEIGDRKNTMQWAVPYAGDLRRALAVLTRMGVKL